MNQKPEEDKPKKTTRASGRGRSLGWEVALRGGTRGLQDYSDWDERHREPRGYFPLKRNSGGRLSRECATYSRNKYISESFRKCGIQDSFFTCLRLSSMALNRRVRKLPSVSLPISSYYCLYITYLYIYLFIYVLYIYIYIYIYKFKFCVCMPRNLCTFLLSPFLHAFQYYIK